MAMHKHHRRALWVILGALVADALCGVCYSGWERIPLWHGLYCALANAVTLGGDVAPVNAAGYIINTIECTTVIPLFAAALSLFTSGLTLGWKKEQPEDVTVK